MAYTLQASLNRKPVIDVLDSATVTQLYFGHTIVATASGAETLTIPLDLFTGIEDQTDGMSFDVIQNGAGAFTIAGAGGVTVTGQGADVATNGAGALITVTKTGPNTYNVSGNRT